MLHNSPTFTQPFPNTRTRTHTRINLLLLNSVTGKEKNSPVLFTIWFSVNSTVNFTLRASARTLCIYRKWFGLQVLLRLCLLTSSSHSPKISPKEKLVGTFQLFFLHFWSFEKSLMEELPKRVCHLPQQVIDPVDALRQLFILSL